MLRTLVVGQDPRMPADSGGRPATEFLLRLEPNGGETFNGTLTPTRSDTAYPFSGWLDLMMLFERLQTEEPDGRPES
jgi:hypothetical protein